MPDATLLGTTAQTHGAAPRGIALRIAADGRFVSRALYGVVMRCSGAGTSPTFDLPRDGLPIGADGRIDDVETGTVVKGATIQRYVERFGGVVGSTGAEGTFSVELSVRSRSTGKRITRCRSGEVALVGDAVTPAPPRRISEGRDVVRKPAQSPVTLIVCLTVPLLPSCVPVPVPVPLTFRKRPVPFVQLTFCTNVPIVWLVNL